jgi:D-alanine--poly(phosphoribitol) ligase subunit 2
MFRHLPARIITTLEQRSGVAVPSPDTDLFNTGVLDSLTFLDLMLTIENDYGIRISLESLDMDKLNSVNGICEYIIRQSQ